MTQHNSRIQYTSYILLEIIQTLIYSLAGLQYSTTVLMSYAYTR